ncbi:MAG: esterase-like activity of phytase family protein [Silicimonas sp.]|nr:esterase-like activity of phytase family protein [Silicimonas sp.]
MRHHVVALTLALMAPLSAWSESLELIGRFGWQSESFVGVSGIEVSADGREFISVADRGWWLEGQFIREGEKITGVQIRRLEAIIGQDGLPVAARRVGDWSDAEGLAIAPDGTAWVTFERWAHVWWFEKPYSRANWVKDHPTFYDHADNWQLEAAAIHPDGTVYVFSEKPLIEGFPIYRLGEDRLWTIDGYLPERDVFAIVGADFDADGTLYLLERKLVVGLWWQSRIRRVRLTEDVDDTLWTSERGEYGNLEGISVWRDDKGLRLTLVADNNGGESEPTEFVEFRLTD